MRQISQNCCQSVLAPTNQLFQFYTQQLTLSCVDAVALCNSMKLVRMMRPIAGNASELSKLVSEHSGSEESSRLVQFVWFGTIIEVVWLHQFCNYLCSSRLCNMFINIYLIASALKQDLNYLTFWETLGAPPKCSNLPPTILLVLTKIGGVAEASSWSNRR